MNGRSYCLHHLLKWTFVNTEWINEGRMTIVCDESHFEVDCLSVCPLVIWGAAPAMIFHIAWTQKQVMFFMSNARKTGSTLDHWFYIFYSYCTGTYCSCEVTLLLPWSTHTATLLEYLLRYSKVALELLQRSSTVTSV